MRAFVALFQLFFLVDTSGNIKLPDLPWNLAVTVGQRVGMKCKPYNISRVSEWTFQRPLSHDKRSIWTNWKDQTKIRNSHFDFDIHEDGSVTFNTNSIQLDDAGIYTCVVDRTPKQPERYSAQMIVFESDPQCNINMSVTDGRIKEFDYIAFRCAVNYSGHWTPSMQWSKAGNAFNEAHAVANINISQDVQQLTSVIKLQVNAEDNDVLITCKTFFIETTDKTNATNVPEYLFYWNTTLHVFFGPRNVTITPKNDIYRKKDVLSCTADGKPSPSYTWRNARTQETIADGPQLALKDAGLEANGRYIIECIAQNHVADQFKWSSATIDIVIQGTSKIIILAGIICAILLLIVTVISRKHIKGWIAKLSSVFRRGPSNEPDILPNADDIQNGDVFNGEFEPYGHYAVPAEILAVGNATRQRVENSNESHAEEEGAAANQPDETMDVKFPVYSQINKTKKPLPEWNIYSSEVAAQAPASTKVSIGLNGTVYAELKTDAGHHQSEASGPPFQNPMFNRSEYASIDHTVEPPPPPPPQRK